MNKEYDNENVCRRPRLAGIAEKRSAGHRLVWSPQRAKHFNIITFRIDQNGPLELINRPANQLNQANNQPAKIEVPLDAPVCYCWTPDNVVLLSSSAAGMHF